MEDGAKRGMTEFLKREIRAWEAEGVLGARRADRQKRRVLMIVAAALVLCIGLGAWLIPLALRTEQEPGQVGEPGGNVPPAQTDGTQGTEAPAPEDSTGGELAPDLPPRDLYAYDYTAVPAGAVPIVPVNLAVEGGVINQTDRVIDLQQVTEAACRVPATRGKVSVLILHTHTGEGYNQGDALWIEPGQEEFARSYDGAQSVVAMGAEIAAALNAAGIGTVHCRTVFDGESNRASYERAADAIRAFLQAYPTLTCVIDVHRAAVTDQAGNVVRSLAVKDGQGIAQTQLICGMGNEQTGKTNLALALALAKGMNADFPQSCAAVVCKEQVQNQQLTPFSLTLEIGTCGNTPAQAKAAAKIAAAAMIPLFDVD